MLLNVFLAVLEKYYCDNCVIIVFEKNIYLNKYLCQKMSKRAEYLVFSHIHPYKYQWALKHLSFAVFNV